MRANQQQKAGGGGDFFRARLDQIISIKYALFALVNKLDWAWLDEHVAESFSGQCRSAETVRFMLGMFMLKVSVRSG